MKSSQLVYIVVRGRRLAVRRWGPAGAAPMVLLHGWMDISASFQFLVDALQHQWSILAPDWRGFGDSQGNDGPYWFPDYLADLDGLLDHYFPDTPVPLVGHSMGGNVACLYAGLRSQRLSHLVSLEGFGINDMLPQGAPARLVQWLEEQKTPPRLKSYPDEAALAARLCRDNPRLKPERARFLAGHLGRARSDGGLDWAGDPWHKAVSPILYRLEEAKACWRQVAVPTLWVRGAETSFLKRFHIDEADYAARLACFGQGREAVLADAGHMLHHDNPEALATLLEGFLLG